MHTLNIFFHALQTPSLPTSHFIRFESGAISLNDSSLTLIPTTLASDTKSLGLCVIVPGPQLISSIRMSGFNNPRLIVPEQIDRESWIKVHDPKHSELGA
jgi:hypothetical protein